LGETLEIALVEPKARIVIAHYSNGGFAYAIPKYPKMDRLVTLRWIASLPFGNRELR